MDVGDEMTFDCGCKDSSACMCDINYLDDEIKGLDRILSELIDRVKLIEDVLNGQVNKKRQEENG